MSAEPSAALTPPAPPAVPAAPAAAAPPPRRHVWRAYHALALLPALGMLGGLPFANRVEPLVLGLPFLVAWLAGWVLATSGLMAIILRLDRRHEQADDAAGRTE